MLQTLTFILAIIVFAGAMHASSCPRCDAANENNLKNPNPYVYYEDYLKANENNKEKEKTEKGPEEQQTE